MKALRVGWEVLRVALSDLARRPMASAVSVAAMAVSIGVLGAFLVLAGGVDRWLEEWSAQAMIEVYVADDASEEAFRELARELAADPAVARVELVTRAEALAEFRQLFPDLGDVEQLVGSNPLPRSLRIAPAATAPGEVARFVEQLAEHELARSVRWDREWIDALAQTGRSVGLLGAAGAAILLGAALAVVGAVVRLALDDKRDEVDLLRLTGAPLLFVVGPLLLGGALLGGVGALCAVGAVELGRELALGWTSRSAFSGIVQLALGSGLPAAAEVLLVVGGGAAGAAAAALTAGRSVLR